MISQILIRLILSLVVTFSVLGCVAEPQPQEPAMGACNNYNPNKQPYFGDTHVHTSFSMDAAQYGSRNDPNQAYEFAKGMPIGLPPYDSNGNPSRTIALDRPLDFVGISDHSEFLAEVNICFNKDSLHYFAPYCFAMRGTKQGGALLDTIGFVLGLGPVSLPGGEIHPSVCTLRPAECDRRIKSAWQATQDAAEAHYDRTNDCSFTTFVGYEWTGSPKFNNQHRNVFFKDQNVPELPTSYFDADLPEELWATLDSQCTYAGIGCEALTIPHNSNLGGGDMFNPITEDGNPYTAELAAKRQRMEPLVEIYQHKGASECINGTVPYASNDELCDFELVVNEICDFDGEDSPSCTPLCSDYPYLLGGSFTGSCVEPSDFVRGALRRGLEEFNRVGVNPFKFGLVGSTDTHNASPGDGNEYGWQGALGSSDSDLEERIGNLSLAEPALIDAVAAVIPSVRELAGFTNAGVYSPGGLAVVWSEQNSRHAIFANMQKRETYGTSGTRIVLRTFAGDKLPEDICNRADFAELGYAKGVPMGSDLPDDTLAPKFAVQALMDAGTAAHPGNPLQKVQIIKGWTEGGESFERVYDVAGDFADYGDEAGVDLATCTPTRSGYANICQVWQDPDFDPDQSAFYYTRVIEVPSCRWSKLQCNAALREQNLTCEQIQINSDHPLSACCDGSLPDTIQERAWSSPIWYKS